jgi:hypothetical protein
MFTAYLFEGSNLPHLGALHGPGSLPGWTFVQLDFDIMFKCKCCKLRTSTKKRAQIYKITDTDCICRRCEITFKRSFLKFKAGEPEASDAKRACTDNEDNKCFLFQFQSLLKPI